MADFVELFQVRLLQVRPVNKSKLLGIVVAELLQVRRPSCHLTNRVKALKDDRVPGWGQHVVKTGQVVWSALPITRSNGASLL